MYPCFVKPGNYRNLQAIMGCLCTESVVCSKKSDTPDARSAQTVSPTISAVTNGRDATLMTPRVYGPTPQLGGRDCPANYTHTSCPNGHFKTVEAIVRTSKKGITPVERGVDGGCTPAP